MRLSRGLLTTFYGAAVVMFSAPTAAAHPEVLNIVSWGGKYTASQMHAYVEPYRAQTDRPIQVDRYTGGLDEVRAQVEAQNIKWDVVDVGLANAIRGCREDLFEPVQHSRLPAGPDGTPAKKDFLQSMLPECAVGQNVFSNVIAHDTRRWSDREPPKSAAAFFDTTKYPGRRGMRRNPRGNLELALIADGVVPEEVYDTLDTEQGLQRAFAKLGEIAPSIVWWEDAGAPSDLLKQQKVAMTTGFNGRLQRAIENQDKPYEIIWDGQTFDYELWAIVKGTPHKQAAMDFIQFASQSNRQAKQAQFIYYGPARDSALAMLKPEVRELLPTAQANMTNALRINHEWWADHQDVLEKRFNEFVERAKQATGTEVFGIGTAR